MSIGPADVSFRLSDGARVATPAVPNRYNYGFVVRGALRSISVIHIHARARAPKTIYIYIYRIICAVFVVDEKKKRNVVRQLPSPNVRISSVDVTWCCDDEPCQGG